MFSLFRSPLDRHFIDDGRVGCPARGCDVESDVCAGCRWLVDMEETAKLPFVRCRPEPRPIIIET
jgi:hypothetical protein